MKLKPSQVITPLLSGLALCLSLAGCSSLNPLDKDVKDSQSNQVRSSLKDVQDEIKNESVQEMWTPYEDFKSVALKPKGDVSIKAKDTPMNILLERIADKSGYALGFTDKVVANYPISVSFSDYTAEQAFRRIGEIAGVAVVIDKSTKTVTFSDMATYTYRIPRNVLSNLKSTFNVGGDTTGNSKQGISGEFKISGETSNSIDSFVTNLKAMAGPTAVVNVVPDQGLITVRGSAQVLSRTTNFINDVVKDATLQIAVEASLVEVSLTDGFQRGVNWSKVLHSKGIDYTVNSNTPTVGGADGQFSFLWTNSSNITNVISAIKQYSKVKVVSQPRLLLMNHTPSTLFDGSQVPYLGKLSVQTQTTGTSSTSGEVEYAIDGLSLSVVANALSPDNIEITLVPTINRVDSLQTFNLGASGSLTAPYTSSRQTLMRVLSDGKGTLVLGGIRQNSSNASTNGIIPIIAEGAKSSEDASELVILLRARAIPGPKYNPLVGEAL